MSPDKFCQILGVDFENLNKNFSKCGRMRVSTKVVTQFQTKTKQNYPRNPAKFQKRMKN